MIAMLEKWITVSQAAEIIGCSGQRLRFLAKNNKIRSEKVGSVWLVDRKQAEMMAKTPAKTGRPRKNQKSS
jgi:excisionase family DNA binding protein